MTLRSWLIRGLILTGLAALAVAGWIANSWVSPDAVRAQVLAHLNDTFLNVDVHLGSARMRIFGGIAVTDLKLVRRGDPTQSPFFSVPSAVLYHDKEQLNRGRLVIRKVELDNPEVRIERNPDGSWNWLGIAHPSPADKPIPTLVARDGVVHIIDRGSAGKPPVTLTQARFTVLNDPLPILMIQAQATSSSFGPVHLRAKLNRLNDEFAVGVELTNLPLGEAAAKAVGRYAPDMAAPLARLTAQAAVKADFTYNPKTTPTLHHDIQISLREGRFEHSELMWPLKKIEAAVRIVDGRVKVEKATAQAGPVALEAALEMRGPESEALAAKETKPASDRDCPPPVSAAETFFRSIEDRLHRLKFTAHGVPLNDKVCNRIPGDLGPRLRRMFEPNGAVDASYEFVREAGGWKREYEIRPKDLRIVYEKFRYPISEVRGWVRRTITQAGQDNTLVKLYGSAGGQPISIDGQVYGNGPDPAVNLRIAGTNVPLDDTLFSAFPDKYPDLVRQFRAGGRGDIVVEVRQQFDTNFLEKTFTVDLRDATVDYTLFPLPLSKVKGRVIVRTVGTDPTRPVKPGAPVQPLKDHDEIVLQDFTAVHAGGTIWLHGSKQSIPNTTDRKLILHVSGSGCPVDAALRKAVSKLKLDSIWTTFSPKGKLTFAADVEIVDRDRPPVRKDASDHEPAEKKTALVAEAEAPAFDPTTDLKMTFNFFGPTVTPSFFPYEIAELSGWLEYKNGKLDLGQFAGRHGESRMKLSAGDVRFYPDGVVWANLGGLEIKPLVADRALLDALPGRLKGPMTELNLRGASELTIKHLVVLTPPDKPAAPVLKPPSSSVRSAPTEGHSKRSSDGGRAFLARGQAASSPLTATASPADGPDPVVYWDAELRLLGSALDVGLPWDDVIGAVGIRGRYEGTHLGQVRGNLWLDQAAIAKQPITRAKVSFKAPAQARDPMNPGQFLPPRFEFQDLTGTLFHGTVGGEARVVLATPPRYEIWLTATDVQLDEVARHYNLGSDADLKGVAQAQVWLTNRPDPKNGQLTLEGAGKVDVPTGRMYNLPVLLDLVKVLKLQAPDKTAFEEGHAAFRLQGNRVKIDQLDLIGAAVCLGGSGEMDVSGDYVRFEFYTIWSQLLKRWLTTPVGDLSAFFSKSLFRIKMMRKDGKLTYEGEIVPLVTEPARNILERVRNQAGRLLGK